MASESLESRISRASTEVLCELVRVLKCRKVLRAWDNKKLELAVDELASRAEL